MTTAVDMLIVKMLLLIWAIETAWCTERLSERVNVRRPLTALNLCRRLVKNFLVDHRLGHKGGISHL